MSPSFNFIAFHKHSHNSATSSNPISKTIITKDFIDHHMKWLAIDVQRFPKSKTTRYSFHIFKLSIIIINNGVHYG